MGGRCADRALTWWPWAAVGAGATAAAAGDGEAAALSGALKLAAVTWGGSPPGGRCPMGGLCPMEAARGGLWPMGEV